MFDEWIDNSLPHARGGVSRFEILAYGVIAYSPRSWGCFQTDDQQNDDQQVFPTLVGVFPPSLPCGLKTIRSSPRSWGCFYMLAFGRGLIVVFPTLVGVFLPPGRYGSTPHSLPHARGGVSLSHQVDFSCPQSSPRSWGCFLSGCAILSHGLCLPHARGGVSTGRYPANRRHEVFPTLVGVFPIVDGHLRLKAASSPRSWGCFPWRGVW